MRIGREARRSGRASALAAIALSLLAPVGPAGAGKDDADPDAEILRRIESLRAQALGLRLDGRARDWKAFPSFTDADSARVPQTSLDIVRVAVAPREDDLVVLLETAGPAVPGTGWFQLDIDFLGASPRDACVQFGAGMAPFAWVHPEDGRPVRIEFPVEVAAAEAVEVRIPLVPLASALNNDESRAWLAGRRRSWVRVVPSTRVAMPDEQRVDTGPAVASFRLAAPPLTLDPPLRPDGEPRRAVRMPLGGKWFVRQGAHGLWSHKGIWAYDLAMTDHACDPTPVRGSKRLEDYYSYGRPVVAPEAGRTAFESAPCEDRAPLEGGTGKDSGNTLTIRLEDGLRLSFGHLQKDSIAFHKGEEFAAGAVLARVGNSGDSGAPHLHLFLSDRPGDYEGFPLAFRDVKVGLNPGPDDAWARDLPVWAIREGWFVQSQ